MRAIERLDEPEPLKSKNEKWLDIFIASKEKRPQSSQYAHKNVREQLNSMSFHKCFYCETKLKGQRKEVDHHIEVSVDETLAFDWNNLFLACTNCNGKILHSTISISDALNPCVDNDEKIKEHLTFNDEFIVPKDNSDLGLKTIQKYRLDKEVLDHKRLTQLKKLYKLLLKIKDKQKVENRNELNETEKEIIYSFKRKDNSFSLMFEVLIEKYKL